jgi:hypothetical protein
MINQLPTASAFARRTSTVEDRGSEEDDLPASGFARGRQDGE